MERPIRITAEELMPSQRLQAAIDAREACWQIQFDWKGGPHSRHMFYRTYTASIAHTTMCVWENEAVILDIRFPWSYPFDLQKKIAEFTVRSHLVAKHEAIVQQIIEEDASQS